MAPADGARTPSRRPYDRRTELPRALPLTLHELEDESPSGRRRVLARLRAALRAERRRGIAGHWTYDLARHAELLRVYRLELALAGPSCRVPGAPGSGRRPQACKR
jgi:hypothetical protein